MPEKWDRGGSPDCMASAQTGGGHSRANAPVLGDDELRHIIDIIAARERAIRHDKDDSSIDVWRDMRRPELLNLLLVSSVSVVSPVFLVITSEPM